MRILEVTERSIPVSRYADPTIPSGGLTTSIVAVTTDMHRDGAPVVGYGFSSIGRFAQGGLIRERFAPRLLALSDEELATSDGQTIDPFRAWSAMMTGEKPGGHGDRSVAVGTLDMALWDAAAKIAETPLYRLLGDMTGRGPTGAPVPVYAGGGYYFPDDDIARLKDELAAFAVLGFTQAKIKIGALPLGDDLARIEAALDQFPADDLAVDAMNSYGPDDLPEVAGALAPYGLRWFEDICDPLDYALHADTAAAYAPPIAAGEALFSAADARNLLRYGGLRPGHDVLVFDPTHCYGVPEYLRIIATMEEGGWSDGDFLPHGGHLFHLHLAAALDLGGCEANPHNFQPFGGFADDTWIDDGHAEPPEIPGIGFEARDSLIDLFRTLTS